jgi:Domain of unknown function (DUF1844)
LEKEMIGKEELYNEEQDEIKVIDKRKFNLDGSLRDGVELEEARPEPKEAIESANIASSESMAETGDLVPETAESMSDPIEDEFDEADFPGADDPASFVNFLSTLASQAAAALGALPHPATGQRSVDLETSKYWIDVLAMLREKTKGNLHKQEAQLFNGLLSDLQMQFVALNRASEEQLLKKAAQKFSANDILGKK